MNNRKKIIICIMSLILFTSISAIGQTQTASKNYVDRLAVAGSNYTVTIVSQLSNYVNQVRVSITSDVVQTYIPLTGGVMITNAIVRFAYKPLGPSVYISDIGGTVKLWRETTDGVLQETAYFFPSYLQFSSTTQGGTSWSRTGASRTDADDNESSWTFPAISDMFESRVFASQEYADGRIAAATNGLTDSLALRPTFEQATGIVQAVTAPLEAGAAAGAVALPLAGGTMAGNINMGQNSITDAIVLVAGTYHTYPEISSNAPFAILGGSGHTMSGNSLGESVISGGFGNRVHSDNSVDGVFVANIGGGFENIITGNGRFASIPGGAGNYVSGFNATAMGALASAADDYSFVWSCGGMGEVFDFTRNIHDLPVDRETWPRYQSKGYGTFCVNPTNGLSGFWVGETTLQSTFDGKADTNHTHTITDVSGLQQEFAAKVSTNHTGAVVIDGVVTIDAANARTNTFGGRLTILGRDVVAGSGNAVGQLGFGAGYANTVGHYGFGAGAVNTVGIYGFGAGAVNTVGDFGFGAGSDNTVGDYGFGAGYANTVGDYGFGAGYANTVGIYGFGAGRRGEGAAGSFVFSDNQETGFDRTAHTNAFSVRASGGTYFLTPNFEVTGTNKAAAYTLGGVTIAAWPESASAIPGPGCTDISASGIISGATANYFVASVTNWTLAVSESAPRYNYHVRALSTNAVTFAGMTLFGSYAPGGTNSIVVGAYTGTTWQVQGGAVQ